MVRTEFEPRCGPSSRPTTSGASPQPDESCGAGSSPPRVVPTRGHHRRGHPVPARGRLAHHHQAGQGATETTFPDAKGTDDPRIRRVRVGTASRSYAGSIGHRALAEDTCGGDVGATLGQHQNRNWPTTANASHHRKRPLICAFVNRQCRPPIPRSPFHSGSTGSNPVGGASCAIVCAR